MVLINGILRHSPMSVALLCLASGLGAGVLVGGPIVLLGVLDRKSDYKRYYPKNAEFIKNVEDYWESVKSELVFQESGKFSDFGVEPDTIRKMETNLAEAKQLLKRRKWFEIYGKLQPVAKVPPARLMPLCPGRITARNLTNDTRRLWSEHDLQQLAVYA